MRWNADLLNAVEGDTRTVKRFLLFPRAELFVEGIWEWRWLEWATIVKVYCRTVDLAGAQCLAWRIVGWEGNDWEDDDET